MDELYLQPPELHAWSDIICRFIALWRYEYAKLLKQSVIHIDFRSTGQSIVGVPFNKVLFPQMYIEGGLRRRPTACCGTQSLK